MTLPSEQQGDGRHLPLSQFDEVGQIPVAAGPGDVRMVSLADLGFVATFEDGTIVLTPVGAGLPEITEGTAGFVVAVNDDEDGFELVEPGGGGGAVTAQLQYIWQDVTGSVSDSINPNILVDMVRNGSYVATGVHHVTGACNPNLQIHNFDHGVLAPQGQFTIRFSKVGSDDFLLMVSDSVTLTAEYTNVATFTDLYVSGDMGIAGGKVDYASAGDYLVDISFSAFVE